MARRRAIDRFPQIRFSDALEPVEVIGGRSVPSPSLHHYLASAELREHTSKYSEIITAAVDRFLGVYLTNGYDEIGAAKELGLPSMDARPSARERWTRSVLTNPIVRENIYLRHRCDYQSRRVTEERLVQELERIAVSNMADYVAPDAYGAPRIAFDMSDRTLMSSIAELSTKRSRSTNGGDSIEDVKIKHFDKLGAISALLKRFETQQSQTAGMGAFMGAAPAGPANALTSAAVGSTTGAVRISITPVPSGAFIPAPIPPHERQDGGDPNLD